MPAQRRKFTEADRISILREAIESGITPVLQKYNLSYSVFYRWKQKSAGGQIPDKGVPSREEIRKIIEENLILKKIVANQALELEIKNAHINKGGEHK